MANTYTVDLKFISAYWCHKASNDKEHNFLAPWYKFRKIMSGNESSMYEQMGIIVALLESAPSHELKTKLVEEIFDTYFIRVLNKRDSARARHIVKNVDVNELVKFVDNRAVAELLDIDSYEVIANKLIELAAEYNGDELPGVKNSIQLGTLPLKLISKFWISTCFGDDELTYKAFHDELIHVLDSHGKPINVIHDLYRSMPSKRSQNALDQLIENFIERKNYSKSEASKFSRFKTKTISRLMGAIKRIFDKNELSRSLEHDNALGVYRPDTSLVAAFFCAHYATTYDDRFDWANDKIHYDADFQTMTYYEIFGILLTLIRSAPNEEMESWVGVGVFEDFVQYVVETNNSKYAKGIMQHDELAKMLYESVWPSTIDVPVQMLGKSYHGPELPILDIDFNFRVLTPKQVCGFWCWTCMPKFSKENREFETLHDEVIDLLKIVDMPSDILFDLNHSAPDQQAKQIVGVLAYNLTRREKLNNGEAKNILPYATSRIDRKTMQRLLPKIEAK